MLLRRASLFLLVGKGKTVVETSASFALAAALMSAQSKKQTVSLYIFNLSFFILFKSDGKQFDW